MAAKIRHYRPACRIFLRHELFIEGQLGDTGAIEIRKNLYSPCGEFTINFPDHPYHGGGNLLGPIFDGPRKSLYDMIDPLDPIEIQLARWEEEDGVVFYVTVLRGLVRSIGRNESVDGSGRVQRSIVISGHDCGAVFLMQQLGFLLSAAYSDKAVPAALYYLKEYALTGEPQPIGDFIWSVAHESTEKIMQTAGFDFERVFSVEKGYALPLYAFSNEGPVWEMLRRYSDAPWNELFVREGYLKPQLVFRPTPWKDATGGWLPDADLEGSGSKTWDIPMRNVIALNAYRDDSEQVEFVFLQNANIHAAQNWQPLLKGFGEFNQELRPKFGDRIQTLQSVIGPGVAPESLPEAEQKKSYDDYYSWLVERTKWMVQAGTDTYKFERGSITIKANPNIQVGDYIHVMRGPLDWSAYVVGVHHIYQPYKQYLMRIEYIRSDQAIKRRELANVNLWDFERRQES